MEIQNNILKHYLKTAFLSPALPMQESRLCALCLHKNTVDDGEPVPIFSSIERDRDYYAGGTRFANIGSSGADSSYVTTLKLEGEGLVDMTYTTDPADYVQMELMPLAQWTQ